MTVADVDRYLAEATHPWPAEVLTSTVTAIRAGGPFREAIKWSHPYFSLNGHAVVKLYAAQEWINIFYYRGAELEDPDGLLQGDGPSGMRRMRIHRDAGIPLHQIQNLSRAAADLAST